MSNNPQPEFAIELIYTKDVSFESPNSPATLLERVQPNLNLDLQTRSNALQDDRHEVVLSLTVTAKSEDKVIFLAEVQQAGIFLLKNFPNEQLHHMLGSFCPNVLFPYGREAIANLVGRGGFPQLNLAPVNFEALYQQHFQAEQVKETGAVN